MRVAALFSMIALAGCASSPGAEAPPPPQTVRVTDGAGRSTTLSTTPITPASRVTVALPADQVWRAMPGVYEKLGIEITTLNQSARVIGSAGLTVRRRLANVPLSRYLDCGRTQGGSSADSYDVTLSIQTVVQPDQRRSTIQTTLSATARSVNFGGADVRCSSTGELEKRIVAEVQLNQD